jgi:hypothetical protein
MFCGILFSTIKDNMNDVNEKETNTDNRGTYATYFILPIPTAVWKSECSIGSSN